MSDEIKTSIKISRKDLDLFTVHDVVEYLKTMFPDMTPEQEFLTTASVKRLVHYSKLGVYSTLKQYHSWDGKKEWFQNILQEKIETHAKYAHLPNEKIVTWNVGSHIYK